MKQKGFTLLELMITVAVVGILAAIAYANYSEQVTKSRRSAGATCLEQAAQYMERYYTTNMTYIGADAALPQCDTETSPFYQVEPAGAITARAYTLQAVPQDVQATRDTKCGTLSVNQAGSREITGTADVTECW
jgi:type IV pilus assembly protein PilE